MGFFSDIGQMILEIRMIRGVRSALDDSRSLDHLRSSFVDFATPSFWKDELPINQRVGRTDGRMNIGRTDGRRKLDTEMRDTSE